MQLVIAAMATDPCWTNALAPGDLDLDPPVLGVVDRQLRHRASVRVDKPDRSLSRTVRVAVGARGRELRREGDAHTFGDLGQIDAVLRAPRASQARLDRAQIQFQQV